MRGFWTRGSPKAPQLPGQKAEQERRVRHGVDRTKVDADRGKDVHTGEEGGVGPPHAGCTRSELFGRRGRELGRHSGGLEEATEGDRGLTAITA